MDEIKVPTQEEAVISDMMTRLLKLEKLYGKKLDEIGSITSPEQKVYFRSEIFLVNTVDNSPSNTDWINSGSSQYIPENAKRAIVYAGIGDTTDGVGYTTIYARGRDTVMPISRIYEDSAGGSASGFTYSEVPVNMGRFDYKIELPSGATPSAIFYAISIVGYIV